MASSTQRELMAEIERLGYTYEGHGGQNAVVMRHPTAGRIRIHATPSDVRYTKNKITEARRRIRMAESVPGKFVTWLMEKHGIGRDERQEMNLPIQQEIEEYLKANPGNGTVSTLSQTFTNDPRVVDVVRKRGSHTAQFTLVGPDYAYDLEAAEKPVQTPLEPRTYKVRDDGSLETPEPNGLPRREERQPMDVIIDQLRSMLAAEVEAEVEDLRARNQLALDALTHASTAIGQALEVLTPDRQRKAATSRPEADLARR